MGVDILYAHIIGWFNNLWSVKSLEKVGIYLRDGHSFHKILETCNMAQFRMKVDELISEGTRAEDIIISDGHDLQARIMERITDD